MAVKIISKENIEIIIIWNENVIMKAIISKISAWNNGEKEENSNEGRNNNV